VGYSVRALEERRRAAELGVRDVLVWTNERLQRWLLAINLKVYPPIPSAGGRGMPSLPYPGGAWWERTLGSFTTRETTHINRNVPFYLLKHKLHRNARRMIT
jgi:hypothetical protein